MTAKLLSTKSLTAAYIGSDFSLSGADFDLNDKEILLIYGREGSGKTLLLRTLVGLEFISGGAVYLDGIDRDRSEFKHRDIGFSFDFNSLDGFENAYETLAYPMKLREYPQGEIEERIKAAVKRFELNTDKNNVELSDFEKSKLLLARMFALDRKIYVVDDVWKDLSTDEKSKIYGKLKTAVEGKTAIIATDDPDMVRSFDNAGLIVISRSEYSEKSSYTETSRCPNNMESAILCGYEIYSGILEKNGEGYYCMLDGRRYAAPKPLSDIYVGKEVRFAICGGNCVCYYDRDCERIISSQH